MTNFKNKKLSQIEEEEEAVSNLDDARKSHLAARERDMQTGINNNLRLANQFKTALAKSRKKTAIPLLKSGFKTAYQGHLEKFLTNGDMDLMKNLNTMQVNGKNFHLFQTIKNEKVPIFPKIENKLNEDHTAQDGILRHIREDSIQKLTMQSRQSKVKSSMRNVPKEPNRGNRRFFTGDGVGLSFGKRTKRRVYTMDNDEKNDRFTRFYTKEPFGNFTFQDDEQQSRQEKPKSASISVTNNEITNNNQNVRINNKMNTYIIIVNDKKQEEFISTQLKQSPPVPHIPKANSDPSKPVESRLIELEPEPEILKIADPLSKIQKTGIPEIKLENSKDEMHNSTEVILEAEKPEESSSHLKSKTPIQHVVLNGVNLETNIRKRRFARFV